MSLLEVDGVSFSYRSSAKRSGELPEARAVDGVSLHVDAGETLAVVGESGSGKSTLARLITRLLDPDVGSIRLGGTELTTARGRALRSIRKSFQMVFQDPYSSLDPTKSIGYSVAEPLLVHRGVRIQRSRRQVEELLDRVGLVAEHAQRFPYELSGGQLQRVAIARALASDPQLIVCDEAVSALDVSVRAQILNLLRDIQLERGVAYVFITHDLSLVRVIGHRVVVMRRGVVVEQGPTAQLFADPAEPYTRALLDAVPLPDPRVRNLMTGLDTPA